MKLPANPAANHYIHGLAASAEPAALPLLVNYIGAHGRNVAFDLDKALMISMEVRDMAKARLLLDAGANPNASDGYAVRWAMSNGDKEAVKMLLERGANPDLSMDMAIRATQDDARLIESMGARVVQYDYGAGAFTSKVPARAFIQLSEFPDFEPKTTPWNPVVSTPYLRPAQGAEAILQRQQGVQSEKGPDMAP